MIEYRGRDVWPTAPSWGPWLMWDARLGLTLLRVLLYGSAPSGRLPQMEAWSWCSG